MLEYLNLLSHERNWYIYIYTHEMLRDNAIDMNLIDTRSVIHQLLPLYSLGRFIF